MQPQEKWKKIINLPHKKCFGCGPANPVGLQLEFESDETVVRTQTVIPERLAGWEKLAHGGILATILDETMAWTVIYLRRSFILTKNMNVQFLRPVFIGDEVSCFGRIIPSKTVERGNSGSPSSNEVALSANGGEGGKGREDEGRSKRDVVVQAEITNQKGEFLARGEGVIATFDGVSIRRFGFLDEEFLTQFEEVVLNQ